MNNIFSNKALIVFILPIIPTADKNQCFTSSTEDQKLTPPVLLFIQHSSIFFNKQMQLPQLMCQMFRPQGEKASVTINPPPFHQHPNQSRMKKDADPQGTSSQGKVPLGSSQGCSQGLSSWATFCSWWNSCNPGSNPDVGQATETLGQSSCHPNSFLCFQSLPSLHCFFTTQRQAA